MNYTKMTDEEIVAHYHSGNSEALEFLVRKYTPLVYKRIKNRFATGFSEDDFVQEGYVGIINAVTSFDATKETSFFTYVGKCIDNNVNHLIEKSQSKKNQFFNSQISLDEERDDLEYETSGGKNELTNNPEVIVISKISNQDALELVKKELSQNELEVYKLMIKGFEYAEIADILDKTPKSIDNTIQRIKNKAKNINV